MLDPKTLIDAITQATKTIKVCVPSEDYYRRASDWEQKELRYVDPESLIAALEDQLP